MTSATNLRGFGPSTRPMRGFVALLSVLCACDVAPVVLPVRVHGDCSGVAAIAAGVAAWEEISGQVYFDGCSPSDHPQRVLAREYAPGAFDAGTGLSGLELRTDEVPIFIVSAIDTEKADGSRGFLHGLGVRDDGCRHAIAIVGGEERAALIAHELGHLHGLGHDDRAGNLMEHSPADAWWLSDDQLDRAGLCE